ncbi:hypothetical protein AS9A_3415 [Hoyosella subflava DQS3-9A1]|uniref:Uncharacterized protein n=1 Tax=Hoyosella subflava (strain DSM 45089 / JCM 17490 / NBRC 109087 / DQS3-9A1) TaxID=443218 RepID=F6EQ35_HOYSD|nr:hypothetical protein AS9A_3415 [Hoyosella subflava DQS3-9A1]
MVLALYTGSGWSWWSSALTITNQSGAQKQAVKNRSLKSASRRAPG